MVHGFQKGFFSRKLSADRERDLWLAAEALVDAAMCSHGVKGGSPISAKEKWILVRALVEKPLLARELFEAGTLNLQ